MKKSLLSLALTFGLVGALNAQDVDVLALVTKGAVSDNSKGVKVLSLDEMKEVKGGSYPVYTMCFDDACLAIANHRVGAKTGTLTPGEETAWKTATLEKDPINSRYYLGFMAENNLAVNGSGQRYNYFTYSAVMLSPNGQIFKLSSQVLNTNLIVRQLSIKYKDQFDRNFGRLRIY